MNKNILLKIVIVFTCLIIIFIIALNPSHKYNNLSISESKWNGIKNSRVENKNLVLEDIKFNDYKLIIDENNNIIYYSLVNDSPNKYNPTISYNASKSIKLAILLDEITDEKIKSNYQFKIMIYDEKEYHIYNLKCTELPILNISYNKDEEIKHTNIPMEMYLFDNLSNIPNKITISRGKIKMNEDNYIFSLNMLTPGKNKRENKLSILNMKPHSEYVLTKVNNTFRNVELFINNEYKGVYSLDHM